MTTNAPAGTLPPGPTPTTLHPDTTPVFGAAEKPQNPPFGRLRLKSLTSKPLPELIMINSFCASLPQAFTIIASIEGQSSQGIRCGVIIAAEPINVP